jgi:hypothetical protein
MAGKQFTNAAIRACSVRHPYHRLSFLTVADNLDGERPAGDDGSDTMPWEINDVAAKPDDTKPQARFQELTR